MEFLFIHLPIFILSKKMDFCGYKKQHSMAAIRNPKLGMNRTRERGGGEIREKKIIKIYIKIFHTLFFFSFFLLLLFI